MYELLSLTSSRVSLTSSRVAVYFLCVIFFPPNVLEKKPIAVPVQIV